MKKEITPNEIANAIRDLLEERDKYKEVLDKIRKHLEKELQEYGGGGLAQEHLNEFNKLLEEIE